MNNTLFLPEEVVEKPFDADYPLQITSLVDRPHVEQAFKTILDYCQYSPFDSPRQAMRRRVVMQAAKELLGPDFAVEEKC